jgi:hypothetical protein
MRSRTQPTRTPLQPTRTPPQPGKTRNRGRRARNHPRRSPNHRRRSRPHPTRARTHRRRTPTQGRETHNHRCRARTHVRRTRADKSESSGLSPKTQINPNQNRNGILYASASPQPNGWLRPSGPTLLVCAGRVTQPPPADRKEGSVVWMRRPVGHSRWRPGP